MKMTSSKLRALALVFVLTTACGSGPETTVTPVATSGPSSTVETTVAPSSAEIPAPASPDTSSEYDGEGIRSKLVEILMERDESLSREAAEVEADRLMGQGAEKEVVDRQLALYSNWMESYQGHPIMGNYWTVDEAECVVIAMMHRSGIDGTARLISDSQSDGPGGVPEEDAMALIEPVAECVDLKDLHLRAAVFGDDTDCKLAGVAADQMIGWYVVYFTDGVDRFQEMFQQDIDTSC